MRLPRIQLSHYVYHITCRCNNKEFNFHSPEPRDKFVEIIRKAKEKYGFKLWNYIIMHNHIHLLITPIHKNLSKWQKPNLERDPESDTPLNLDAMNTPQKGTISDIMHWINSVFAHWYNRQYGRVGHFFEGRFRSTIVQENKCFINVHNYITLNLITALRQSKGRGRLGKELEAVKHPKDWKWCGYHAYANGKSDGLIDIHPIFLDNESITHSLHHHHVSLTPKTPRETENNKTQEMINKNENILLQQTFSQNYCEQLNSAINTKTIFEHIFDEMYILGNKSFLISIIRQCHNIILHTKWIYDY